MVTSALSTEREEVEREPATLDLKVEQELQDIVPQAERDFNPTREVTTAWFYWSPSPGVRCYTYGEPTKPVQQIRLPNI